MARILVTGGTGFVGRALVPLLADRGHAVVCAVRQPSPQQVPWQTPVLGDLTRIDDWAPHLAGVDAVVWLAARVHRMTGDADDYAAINTAAPLRAAAAAAALGVRRFLYLSSVKALGDGGPGRPWRDGDPPAPGDAYGRSKLAADEGLARIAHATGMEAVSLRPPLVFGPGVGANFKALLRQVHRGLPVPVAAAGNRRSLIFVDNLADAIVTVLEHPGPVTGTWLVADRPALGTADLVRLMAQGMGRPARTLPLPPALLDLVRPLPRIGPMLDRLTGSLTVDDSGFRTRFGRSPPTDLAEAVKRTAARFRAERAS